MATDLWAGRDRNGALYLFDHEPRWVEEYGAWDCNKCGRGRSLWFEDSDVLLDLLPGEKCRVGLVREPAQ